MIFITPAITISGVRNFAHAGNIRMPHVIDVSGDSNPKGSMLCDGPAEGVDDANKQSIRRGPRIKAGQIHHGRNEFHTVKERFKALGDKIDGAKGSLRPRRPA